MACSKSTEKRTEGIIKNPHPPMVLNNIFIWISSYIQGYRKGRQGGNEIKPTDQNEKKSTESEQSPTSLENHKVNLCFKGNQG